MLKVFLGQLPFKNMSEFKRKFSLLTVHAYAIACLIGITLLSDVECRAPPRQKSYGKVYSKDILKMPLVIFPDTEIYNATSNCTLVSWSSKNCIIGPLSVNKDLPPSVFKKLCQKPSGRFAVSKSCRLFVTCQNDSLTVNQCPKFTYFNSLNQSCANNATVSCFNSEKSDQKFIDSVQKKNFLIESFPIIEIHVSKPDTHLDSVRQHLTQMEETMDKSDDVTRHQRNESQDIWKSFTQQTTQPSISNSSSQDQNHERSDGGSRLGKTLLESESRHPEGQEVSLCSSYGDGIHPHPQSCGYFIQCVAGKEYIQMCAPGTVFNPKTSVCDWETNVPECHGTGTHKSIFNDNRVKRSVTLALHNDDNHSIILNPPGTGVSNQLLSREKRSLSRHPRRKCTSSEEYIQPHAIHCNKFEICSNGRIVEETCGMGAMFNPLSLVCDLPHNVDCTSRKIDFGTYDCQKNHKYRASHPETCSKFIECDRGNLHVKTCPPGTLYDAEEELCDHSYKIKCKKPISLEHDTDVNYIPRPSRANRASQRNSLNLACEYNYIAPHPIYCNQFVECEDRRIFIKSCGPGTVFNEEIGVCDWAYNTRKPDPLDCSRYLQCERGQYAIKTCLRSTVYHKETKKCVFSPYASAYCRSPSTTTRPTTTERITSTTTEYYPPPPPS